MSPTVLPKLVSRSQIYDSEIRAPAPVEELVAVWQYRDLVAQLVSRDIKARYKRSILGVIWTMLNPLLTMSVLVIVFGQVFRVQTPNYPAYLLSGVLIWNFFAQTTTAAMYQLTWGSALLRKVYVPRAVFTIAAVGTGLANLLLALVPLAVLMIFTGAPITPALLWLVVAVPIAALFALGVALLVSALSISFHDVIEMYAVAVNAWFFLTPVMYPIDIVPSEFLPIVEANPMTSVLALFRAPIHDGLGPAPEHLFSAAFIALAAFALGWTTFTLRADRIAYHV